MKIAQEEIFGPVLATLSFDDVDQVIEQANHNPYGLAAAVWTRDVKKAHLVSRQLKAGTVWINTYGLMDASCRSAATRVQASVASWVFTP